MIKNLNQLKRALRPGMRLEVIGHCRPGCIGQLREVTWVNTQGFYTKTLNPPDPKLNAANEGRGAILWWGAARTWEFEDGVCKSYTRSEHTAETLIMAFRVLEKEGLSEGTLEKLIGRGWIHSYLDIYRLDQHRNEIIRMDGFGEKSWQRLWDAIQQSRNTTFERHVIAMDIPMVGNTASRALCREFHGSLDEFRDAVYGGYDFRQLPDFGETLHNNIQEWFNEEENFCVWEELQMMMNIQKPAEADNQTVNQDNRFSGKTIVVTGKVEPYTRDEMNSLIASLGAVAGSSVTRKTDYLVCGEKAGSKLAKARELSIPVLTPEEFFRMAGVA